MIQIKLFDKNKPVEIDELTDTGLYMAVHECETMITKLKEALEKT